jgi:N-acyl-D-aspartate/D-glutamate deacylase
MSQRDSVRKEAEMVAADQQDRFEMQETAQLFNMLDRGVLSPGMKADINVINYEQLGFSKAEMAYDFPTGARRLVQRGHGYELTMVSGVATVENDEFTGALPGKLVRS